MAFSHFIIEVVITPDGLFCGRAPSAATSAVTDSLAGRMEVLALLALASCELENSPGRWLEMVFTGGMPRLATPDPNV